MAQRAIKKYLCFLSSSSSSSIWFCVFVTIDVAVGIGGEVIIGFALRVGRGSGSKDLEGIDVEAKSGVDVDAGRELEIGAGITVGETIGRGIELGVGVGKESVVEDNIPVWFCTSDVVIKIISFSVWEVEDCGTSVSSNWTLCPFSL